MKSSIAIGEDESVGLACSRSVLELYTVSVIFVLIAGAEMLACEV
jgi:hypothetical protein